MKIRDAPFALQVVRRRAGDAAILYRRSLDAKRKERLTRIAPISPIAFAAGSGLLRAAVRATSGNDTKLTPGPFFPLDPDWGARVACYALVASGLHNPERLFTAATNFQHADAAAQYRLRGSDAVYAAVALRFGSVLVTLDREQRERLEEVVTSRYPAQVLADMEHKDK